MCHFYRRTAEPLEPFSAPGNDKPTSRCQTTSSIRALRRHQPVIPGVPFIRWAMTYPYRITGSLWPTFVPVWNVFLTVKQALLPFNSTVRTPNQSPELTFVHLRYFFGGDPPSQTINLTAFWLLISSRQKWKVVSQKWF